MMTLNFFIERDKQINANYFTACLKLIEQNKRFLHNKGIEFNNLDSHLQLDNSNFYIWYNNYGYRDELYYKTGKKTFTHPINHLGLRVELSNLKCGFYPLRLLYNLNVDEKEKLFDVNDEILTNVILNHFLSNSDDLSVLQVTNILEPKIAKEKREKELKEKAEQEKVQKKLRQLKQSINKGKLTIYKVEKGEKINNKSSTAILKPIYRNKTKKIIKLNMNKFYIDEDNYLNCVNDSYDDFLDVERLVFVLNLNTELSLKSGFYTMRSLKDLDSNFCYGLYIDKDELLNIAQPLEY